MYLLLRVSSVAVLSSSYYYQALKDHREKLSYHKLVKYKRIRGRHSHVLSRMAALEKSEILKENIFVQRLFCDFIELRHPHRDFAKNFPTFF